MLKDENGQYYFLLNNYRRIPVIGLGTFNAKHLVHISNESAKIGYRLFDTSAAYGTESRLKKGLWGNFFINNQKERAKYQITTKLFLDHCFDKSEYLGLKNSLKTLGTNYIDNYLLHWAHPDVFIRNYKEMEKFYRDGLVRSIGVCNMDIPLLEKLLNECEIIPAINQIEITPIFTQKEVVKFCEKNNILVMSYTPFARMEKRLFNNSILKNLGLKYNKKETQIILRWNIQQNRCVIPKTANIDRLKENFNIFDFNISDEDLIKIDEMNEDYRVRYSPDKYPIEWRLANANY